uniref:Uncharacterized protein n=1 Tax=Panagrolaimus sp. PS1159 TaxID=55785 RepID=A0AC35FZC4_9BILA
MHLFLIIVITLQFFQTSNAACKCVCSTCGAPPTFVDPPPTPGTTRGTGSVTQAIGASGCMEYTVTCDAQGTNWVSMGANGTQLTPSSRGAKSFVLTCTDNKEIEACNMAGDSVTTDTVYCASSIPVCSTCGDLPMTGPPASSTGTASGPGRVVPGTDPNTGCKMYTVNCDAVGNSFVVVGANEQFTQLSAAGPGAKSATLYCNDAGQIMGADAATGAPLVVTSVYCSYAT